MSLWRLFHGALAAQAKREHEVSALTCWRCGAPGRYICDACAHAVMTAANRDPEDEYEVDWP